MACHSGTGPEYSSALISTPDCGSQDPRAGIDPTTYTVCPGTVETWALKRTEMVDGGDAQDGVGQLVFVEGAYVPVGGDGEEEQVDGSLVDLLDHGGGIFPDRR